MPAVSSAYGKFCIFAAVLPGGEEGVLSVGQQIVR